MVAVGRLLLKYRFIVFGLFLTMSFGCGNKTTYEPYYESDYGDLKYTIDGVRDTSIEQTGEMKTIIYINRSEGKIEDVSLSISGLPKGVTYAFEPGAAKPSFNTILTIKSIRAAEGKYLLTIRGSSITSGFTERKMNLTILPYSNPASGLEGQFKESGMCTPSGAVGDTVDVVTVDGIKNKIDIKGFWSGVWANKVRADINPASKTLSIPSQMINGVTISGNGTYTDNVMIIGYRVDGTIVHDTCTSTFSRL